MKKVAPKIVILCTLLCVAGMQARRFSAINGAALPLYVGLFSVAGNDITDAASRPVYKLPKSGKNRTIKPYAVFDFYGDANQTFIFSANLEEFESALRTAQLPADTVFSTLFTYQPEPEETSTLFEIQSERVNTSDEAITQRLIMKPLGPKAHLGSLHTREEVNLSRRKAVERRNEIERKEIDRLLKRSQSQEPENEELEAPVNIVVQSNALSEAVGAAGNENNENSVMFHEAPKRTVTTLAIDPEHHEELRSAPAAPKRSRWHF